MQKKFCSQKLVYTNNYGILHVYYLKIIKIIKFKSFKNFKVSWGCRIHQLCRGVTPIPHPNECPDMTLKNMMVRLWECEYLFMAIAPRAILAWGGSI